jgi:transposase
MSFIRKIKKGDKVYLAEVENIRINGIVCQRHIKYIGKEADGKKILSSSISNIEVEQVKLSGPLLVLNYLAKEIKLAEILGEYGEEILSLVFAHCIDYKSINQMSYWFERTDLNMILNLDGLTEARLLQALDSLEAKDSTKLQVEIFNNVKNKYKIDHTGIIYDVTNTYLYGKKCLLGKLGKDKDGVKGRPLIQIGLGVTKSEGIPIFHKVFNGNIHDARTLSDSLTAFKEYGIKDGLIIFDRGINSKKNHQDIFSLKWNVLCGVPLNDNIKSILRIFINKNAFLDYKNRVKLNKTIFYVIDTPYTIGKTKGTIVFCYNEQLKKDIKESRFDEINNAQNLLKTSKKIKLELEKFFDKKGNLLLGQLNITEEFDGYSCIFTTEKLSNENLVRLYFDKDIVEKAFQSLKGIVKVQPIRHWLYNRVIAHVFICYLSYLLLSLLKYKLKKIEISPIVALRELDSLYRVYIKDKKKEFKISRMVALTKQQEKIIRCIDRKLLNDCSV